uniref:Transmembrane protein n=1 Tax=Globodera rostochiensis TaxID=31243 RepID=A0A914I3E8_GLORO
MDNKSVTTNKYGLNNNEGGTTCCCGCVSIETGINVVAMIFFSVKMISGIFLLTMLNEASGTTIGDGLVYTLVAGACLLVVYGQHARNPWLFVPYLIAGVVEVIKIGYETTIVKKCHKLNSHAKIIMKMQKNQF